jgi:hypothetical protein
MGDKGDRGDKGDKGDERDKEDKKAIIASAPVAPVHLYAERLALSEAEGSRSAAPHSPFPNATCDNGGNLRNAVDPPHSLHSDGKVTVSNQNSSIPLTILNSWLRLRDLVM